MNLEECELAILRSAVDQSAAIQNEQIANSPEVKRMLHVTEQFLRRKRLVCYGGTAINNLLPKKAQFYNYDVDVPDYDAFSDDALHDAKSLANEYVRAGFMEVEAKTGVHHGTFKVFVNFIPMADITHMPKELFRILQKKAHSKKGILYAPPDFLRMGMYLELSRPRGEVDRWEKVLKRLALLNQYHPLKSKKCNQQTYQRKLENIKYIQETMASPHRSNPTEPSLSFPTASTHSSSPSRSLRFKTKKLHKKPTAKQVNDLLYDIVLKAFVMHKCVFFGSNAVALYAHYLPKSVRDKFQKIPDFDVLSENPEETATFVAAQLETNNFANVKILRHEGVGEIIAPHYEVRVGKDTIAFIYQPVACHSYNVFQPVHATGANGIGMRGMRVATIDTILSFYLAFLFVDRPYYDVTRLMCMAQFLLDVQRKNRLAQTGLLKRFSLNCVGHQPTISELRSEKAAKFKELKGNRDKREYEEWFLRYHPGHVSITTAEQLEHMPSTAYRTRRRTARSRRRKSRSSRSSSRSRTYIRTPSSASSSSFHIKRKAKQLHRIQDVIAPPAAKWRMPVPSSSSSSSSRKKSRRSNRPGASQARAHTRTRKRATAKSKRTSRTLRNPKNPFRTQIDELMQKPIEPTKSVAD